MNENVNIVSSGEAHDKCLPRDSIFSSSALLQSSVSGRRTARGSDVCSATTSLAMADEDALRHIVNTQQLWR